MSGMTGHACTHWYRCLHLRLACLQVHHSTSKLTATPASPEDFADLLSFLGKLELRRHGLDEIYDHVSFATFTEDSRQIASSSERITTCCNCFGGLYTHASGP